MTRPSRRGRLLPLSESQSSGGVADGDDATDWGSGTYTPPPATITVEESDAAPSVSSVDTVIFDSAGFAVTDNADGSVTVEALATGGGVDLGRFNVKDYGALGDGSTDDTSAIQDTVDAAVAAGGGTIYFPAGVYIVGGSLQDTGAFNGQILLPNVSHGGDHLVLTFRGALRPGFHPVYGDTVPLAAGLSVIKSTLTGASGTAACISGGNDTGSPSAGHGNNLEVWVDDLVCLGPDNPTFTFWNLSACQGGGVGSLQISTPGAFAGSATQPTHSNAYGIKLPGQYFANTIDVGTLSVGGFYTGILDGELTTYRNIILGPLIYGIEFTATFYPTIVLRMQPTSVQRVMKGTGDHRVDVIQYAAEHSTSPSWAVTVYDVDDASNHLYGFVRWYNAATGGTADHSFVVNGGANLGSQEIGSAWGSASIADILDIPTAETDTTLVLAPDGAGGVEFRAESGGSGGQYRAWLFSASGGNLTILTDTDGAPLTGLMDLE